MKTYENALINPAVAAEIEALHQEINDLKKVVNANKAVLFDLLEHLKNAAPEEELDEEAQWEEDEEDDREQEWMRGH